MVAQSPELGARAKNARLKKKKYNINYNHNVNIYRYPKYINGKNGEIVQNDLDDS